MTADPQKNLCKVCGMPQDYSKTVNIVDWISVCTCKTFETASSDSPTVVCCKICGKKMKTSRKGSMTSWIFQVDLCSCQTPQPDVESSIEEDLELLTFSLKELEADSQICLDEKLFPVERYTPLRLIGFGESGFVYLCKDNQLNKKVAVKQLHFSSTSDLEAFQKEARISSKIEHSNIVRIQDFGSTKSGIPYMVSEYINGIPLHKLLASYEKLPIDKSLEIAIQICSGLAYAHEQGILHGDLCPQNILLTKGSLQNIDAKLIDFGVARVLEKDTQELAERSQVIGSACYLAPDKILGHDWTKASEVYSIGCILFEMFTGSPPYQGVSPLNTIQLHANADIPTLMSRSPSEEWSDELEEVIHTALSKDPEKRYSSVDELKRKLQYIYDNDLFTQEEREEDYTSTKTRTGGTLSSRPKTDTLVLVSIALGLCAVAGGAMYLVLKNDPLDSKNINEQFALIEKNTKGTDPNTFDIRKPSKKYQIQKRRLFNSQIKTNWLIARYNFTDSDLASISKTKNIRVFSLSSTKVTGVGFKNLEDLDINSIYLNSSALTDEGLKTISNIQELKSLEIKFCKNISSKGIKCLPKLKNLFRLAVSGNNLTDTDLRELAKITSLQTLNLNHNKQLTDKGFEVLLKNLPRLRGLHISHTGASPKLLNKMDKSKIRMLSIVGIGMTDKDLKNPNLDNLVYLEVGDKNITNSGLETLVRLKNLKSLSIQYSPNVNRKATDYIRKKLPRCYVFGK